MEEREEEGGRRRREGGGRGEEEGVEEGGRREREGKRGEGRGERGEGRGEREEERGGGGRNCQENPPGRQAADMNFLLSHTEPDEHTSVCLGPLTTDHRVRPRRHPLSGR